MRTYASNDYNASVSFTINNYIMGSSILTGEDLVGVISLTDTDGEAISAVQVYGGKVGGGEATLIHTATTNTTFTISQMLAESWYYYAVITQMDGNKVVTSPIRVTKTGGTLPIVLTNFKGVLDNNQVLLTWSTASEINASHFIIERLVNSGQFDYIGRLDTRGADRYNFIDKAPVEGANYYRLKQVDKDGKVEYSKVISVKFETENFVSIAPNPSRGNVRINTTLMTGQKVLIQVIDIAGNLVYNKTFQGGATIDLNLFHLLNSTYVIRVNQKISQIVISK